MATVRNETIQEQIPITAKPCSVKYNPNDVVALVKASYGWGTAKQGDLLIIDVIDKAYNKIYGVLKSSGNNFMCSIDDVRAITDTENMDNKRILTEKQEKFFSKMKQVLPYVAKDINTQISRSYDDVIRMQKELSDMKELTANLYTLLRSSKARAGNKILLDSLKSWCDAIADKYELVEYDNGNIIAFTYPIEYDIENMHIVYGAYKVVISVISNTVNVFPVDKKTVVKDRYAHPNVLYPVGTICMGTYTNHITSALADKNMARVLHIMHDLLTNESDNGAYIRHGHWAVDAKDRCDECWELLDNCVCRDSNDENICSECGRDMDDCGCTRCPSTNDVLDGDFPDSYCMRCRHFRVEVGNEHYAYCSQDSSIYNDEYQI